MPDLSDMTGGLSNRAYFNFVDYILWKVRAQGRAARHKLWSQGVRERAMQGPAVQRLSMHVLCA